jgi:hypothetical protein
MERGVTHGKMAELLYGLAYLIIAIADHVDRLEKAKAKRHA